MPIPQQTQPMSFQIKASPELFTVVRGTLTSMFRTVDFSAGRLIEVSLVIRGRNYNYSQAAGPNLQHLDSEINRSCYNQRDRETA